MQQKNNCLGFGCIYGIHKSLSKGPAVVSGMNSPNAIFCPVDVTKSEDVAAALEETKVVLECRTNLSLEFAGKVWETGCCCQLCWDRGGLQSLQFQQGQGSLSGGLHQGGGLKNFKNVLFGSIPY